MRIVVALILIVFAFVGYHLMTGSAGSDREAAYDAAAAGPSVNVDALSPEEARGRLAFNAACAACHGRNALGSDAGPPLIHRIYEPSHHGDAAFQVAVQNGVQAHHWNFGNMPPQPGVTRAEVANIIAFVRAAQRQNGIN